MGGGGFQLGEMRNGLCEYFFLVLLLPLRISRVLCILHWFYSIPITVIS